MTRLALLLTLALATPAQADTTDRLEIVRGNLATVYEGSEVSRDFWENRGRIDFASWNSFQEPAQLTGSAFGNWTVVIDGQPFNDCGLVKDWSRSGSAKHVVLKCGVVK